MAHIVGKKQRKRHGTDTSRTSLTGPQEAPAYGLWPLVIINAPVFILVAFSFTKPRTVRDWRSLGAFAAFLVALFTEMYGFPLTLYLLSGWLASAYPGLDLLSHNSGHLLQTLLGWKGDPHLLEVGRGRGIGLEILPELGAAHVTGFDLDPKMVALAPARVASYGGRVRVFAGNAAAIEAPDASFDAVVD